MKHHVVDRFEGEYAYLEDKSGNTILVERSHLPADTAEGTCLIQTKNGWEKDDVKKANRREVVEKKMNVLFKRRENK